MLNQIFHVQVTVLHFLRHTWVPSNQDAFLNLTEPVTYRDNDHCFEVDMLVPVIILLADKQIPELK